MGFIMDGIEPEQYDRDYTDGQLVQRILHYFRPFVGPMVTVAATIFFAAGLDALWPLLIATAIDRLAVVTDRDPALWRDAAWLFGAILASGIGAWCLNVLRQWLTAKTIGNVVLDLRTDAFDAVMARDMSFYDEFSTGRIVSRVTSDTQEFTTVVTLTLNLMSQVLQVVILVGVLFVINARLAAIALIIAPFIIAAALAFRRYARHVTRQARRVLANVNATVQESITGISVAKAFRQESSIYAEFQDVNQQSYRLNLLQGLVFSAIFPVLGIIAGLGTVLVVYFGGTSVMAGSVTAGQWFLFIEAVAMFWSPLTSIASFWSQFQLGLSASERVFALIDAEPRVTQVDQLRPALIEGRIAFDRVDFRYNEQEQVLRGFDLTIEAGETVALVGHTGAGKSSLGKLIARYYEFQGGKLSIDGHDIRSLDLAAYRRRLGIVQQTPFLFGGSVRDNIRYGRPDATDREVVAAAAGIGGGDWLDALSHGLDTNVGEGGRGVSMGQRQLVAMARVLLGDPAILILDEATASVDPLTEAQIQEGLEAMLRGRTAIVIAHRLSTIRSADRILVLQRGTVIEEGNHASLLKRAGTYAQLYDTYFRHQSPEYDPYDRPSPEPTAEA